MRDSRPVEDRARNYGYQGSLSGGHLGAQMGDHRHHNFYTNPNPNLNVLTTTKNCCIPLVFTYILVGTGRIFYYCVSELSSKVWLVSTAIIHTIPYNAPRLVLV